jgi:hypothetical protein
MVGSIKDALQVSSDILFFDIIPVYKWREFWSRMPHFSIMKSAFQKLSFVAGFAITVAQCPDYTSYSKVCWRKYQVSLSAPTQLSRVIGAPWNPVYRRARFAIHAT